MPRPPITQANLDAAEERLESSLAIEIVPTLRDAISRLKDVLIEARKAGHSWEQMAQDLKVCGIDIEPDSLRVYLGKIIRADALGEGRPE